MNFLYLILLSALTASSASIGQKRKQVGFNVEPEEEKLVFNMKALKEKAGRFFIQIDQTTKISSSSSMSKMSDADFENDIFAAVDEIFDISKYGLVVKELDFGRSIDYDLAASSYAMDQRGDGPKILDENSSFEDYMEYLREMGTSEADKMLEMTIYRNEEYIDLRGIFASPEIQKEILSCSSSSTQTSLAALKAKTSAGLTVLTDLSSLKTTFHQVSPGSECGPTSSSSPSKFYLLDPGSADDNTDNEMLADSTFEKVE